MLIFALYQHHIAANVLSVFHRITILGAGKFEFSQVWSSSEAPDIRNAPWIYFELSKIRTAQILVESGKIWAGVSLDAEALSMAVDPEMPWLCPDALELPRPDFFTLIFQHFSKKRIPECFPSNVVPSYNTLHENTSSLQLHLDSIP